MWIQQNFRSAGFEYVLFDTVLSLTELKETAGLGRCMHSSVPQLFIL